MQPTCLGKTAPLFPARAFLALALLIGASSARADTSAPGYEIQNQAPNPAFVATSATLAGGDIVTFDGQTVDRFSPTGTFVANLATFPVATFPSFCIVRPTGDAVLIGESSQHDLYLVPLNGSGPVFVANVVFNYDARFEDDDQVIVSAARTSSVFNDLVRVDVTNGQQTTIATVSGPSGPVALDAFGNLYYGTQQFPPPAGGTNVITWTAAQTHGTLPLSQNDATIFASGLDGASSMAFDPISGALFVAESNFVTGTERIVQVGAGAANLTPVATSAGSVGGLEILSAGGPASLEAYQPGTGSFLRYDATDFFSFADLVTVRPKRPTLTISGAGTTGPGAVTLALDGGVPNGAAQLLYSGQGSLLQNEQVYVFPGFLWHSTFVPGQVRRIPFLIPTDATGHGQITFFNPGNLDGVFGWQFWIANAQAQFQGSTPVATF